MLLINKNLLRLSKGLRGWILLIVALKLMVLVGVANFSQTIAGFLSSLYSDVPSSEIGSVLLAALAASLVILVGNLLVGEAEYRVTAKSRLTLREQLYDKILKLDVSNVDKFGTANAMASVVDGVEAMQVYYSKYLPGLIYYFIAPIYIFLKIRRFSWQVALFLLIVSFFILPINNLFRTKIEKRKAGYWRSLREMTAHYLESLRALSTLKLFNRDEDRTWALKEKADDFNKTIMSVMRINFLATMTTNALMYLSIFDAILILCRQSANGALAMRQSLTVLMLSYSFYSSSRMLMDATHRALNGIAAAQNIEEVLDIDTTKPSMPRDGQTEVEDDGLRLNHVSFAYPDRETTLKDVSMHFPNGKVTALVGPSGSGKSTVIAHLLRFLDPKEGNVTVDGIDMRCYSPEEIRRRISMVPQSISLFSGTIADNVRIAKPDATDEEILDTLDKVHLMSWIRTLNNGIYEKVGDAGCKLSGGQRQKLGIARALLSNAPYIVFDEATSSVDPESENEIWNCIRGLAKTRTLVIISHRLSTVRWAENIYVLDKGRVAESGSHDQLLKNDGLYAELTREQQALEKHGLRRAAVYE